MTWTPFWTQFSAAIDSNPDLSLTNKLTYLREAIKDPSINPLLYSAVKSDNHYDHVVEVLRNRFNKKRIVHANYCKSLIDTTTVKNTSSELQIHSVIPSWAYKVLDNTTWTLALRPFLSNVFQSTYKLMGGAHSGLRHCPTCQGFLSFVRVHALGSTSSTSSIPSNSSHEPKLEKKYRGTEQLSMSLLL